MTLRMRVLPRFPAKITATNGLTVERPAGTPDLIVKPDFGSLVQIPSVENPDEVFFWAWDRQLGLYRRMSFADLFAGVADLGFMQESVYDPQNIHDDAFARANHTGTQAIATVSGLQTALDAQTAALATKAPKSAYATKSGNYPAAAGDAGATLRFTAAATLSLTGAATLGNGWPLSIIADGGAVTIDPNGSETINGGATLVVPQGSSATIICDGSNFFTVVKPNIWEPVGAGKFTLTAASSLNITDLSAYRMLKISGNLTPSAAASGLYLRSSTNNGSSYDSGASDYTNQTLGGAGSGVGAAGTNDNTLAIVKNTVLTLSFETLIFNFGVTGNMHASSRAYTNLSAGGATSEINGGQRSNTAARNAIQLIPGGGVTLSGVVTVEGVRA